MSLNISLKEVFNFHRDTGVDFRQQNVCRRVLINSGAEMVSFPGSKILEIIHKKIKKLESLNSFIKERKIGNQMTALAGYIKL